MMASTWGSTCRLLTEKKTGRKKMFTDMKSVREPAARQKGSR
jgi:hypothetical protein